MCTVTGVLESALEAHHGLESRDLARETDAVGDINDRVNVLVRLRRLLGYAS